MKGPLLVCAGWVGYNTYTPIDKERYTVQTATDYIKQERRNNMPRKQDVGIPFQGSATVAELYEVREKLKPLKKREEALSKAVKGHLNTHQVTSQEWQEEGVHWQAKITEQDRRSIDEEALIDYLNTQKPEVWDKVKKVVETIDQEKLIQAIENGLIDQNEIPMKGSIIQVLHVKNLLS